MKTLVLICTLAFLAQGCIPVAVGMGIWSGAKHDKQRKEFVTNLNQMNLEREKAGLQPLDFCDEAKKAGMRMKNCGKMETIGDTKAKKTNRYNR